MGHMGVSINGGSPRWFIYVYFMEKPIIKIDDLGIPPFSETSIWDIKDY